MSTPVSSHQNLKTTSEILVYIHEHHLKNDDDNQNSTEWMCALAMDTYRKEWVEELNKWIDAAESGDWDSLFKVAVNCKLAHDIGRLANSTRLLPKDDSPTSAGTLAGYTALHHAAWHGAPVEIVQGLIELGASREFTFSLLFCLVDSYGRTIGGIRTRDDKRQRPLDLAQEKHYEHLYDILTPRGLPEVSDETLLMVETHFHKVILEESRGRFKPDSMRFPDLGLLRDQQRIWMPIPEMYGGFNFWWDDGHLVTESFCRVVGGSGRTNHITSDGSQLVADGWG